MSRKSGACQATDEEELYQVDNKNQNDSPLCRALNQFRVDFTEHSIQEKIFNPQHLIKVFELYEECVSRFSEGSSQCSIMWKQVVGYVQRFLPANIAQDFAIGFKEREKSKVRSFEMPLAQNCRMYPLCFKAPVGLGFDYAAIGDGRAERFFWKKRGGTP